MRRDTGHRDLVSLPQCGCHVTLCLRVFLLVCLFVCSTACLARESQPSHQADSAFCHSRPAYLLARRRWPDLRHICEHELSLGSSLLLLDSRHLVWPRPAPCAKRKSVRPPSREGVTGGVYRVLPGQFSARVEPGKSVALRRAGQSLASPSVLD